jgi:stress response protein YsnF
VVGTEAVAVERVKLGTETVTETETVGGEVRKEQIAFDTTGDSTGDSTGRSTNRS